MTTCKKNHIQFHQPTVGVHTITDSTGNEIKFDVNTLDLIAIRNLINGIGSVMQSLTSSAAFEKECD